MGTRAFIRKGARVLLHRIQSCPPYPFDTDQETSLSLMRVSPPFSGAREESF